jgi:hypothetical protein
MRKFHPLADIFPLMEGAEFDAFVEDIRRNGLREKIDLYDGMIAEGRNRYRALQRLGIDPEREPKKYFRKAIYVAGGPQRHDDGKIPTREQLKRHDDDRVRAYIISKNIHRRHLTAEQRRELIGKLIAAAPQKSDRQIAETVKASPSTVGKVRREKEAKGEVSKLDTRTDRKGVQQPARKERKAKPKPQPAPEPVTPPHVTTYDSPLSAAWARASREQKRKCLSDHWKEVEDIRADIIAVPQP